MELYRILDRSFYLADDGPFAVLSENKNGCVALTFETEKYAQEFVRDNIKSINSRGIKNPEVKPVENAYDFMQLCARYGYAGIELLSEEDQKSFLFCVRLEEVSSTFPTALTINIQETSYIKTKFKEYSETTYRTIKEWQRYDILDKVSAKFAVNQPFRDWDHKTLFEIRTSSNAFLSLFRVPCRHNYNSLDGSVPFFTTVKYAIEFLNSVEFRTHLMYISGPESKFNELAIDLPPGSDSFKIIRIDDLHDRLNEINNPSMGYVINPNGTRDSMGYGHLSGNNEGFTPMFYGVSGNWKVLRGNNFEKIEKRDYWNGADTFFWNKINGYRLAPLDRSFSSESSSTKFSELSEFDIEDLIQVKFVDREFSEDEIIQFSWPESEEEKIKAYSMIWWDAVTGEGKDEPFFFDSILDLIIWLWQYECCRDYPIRRDGAHQCNGFIGVPATSDKEYENNIHVKIKEQLIRIYKRIAVKGYKPKDGNDLSGLINRYFRTIHIDLLGYTKDVIFQLDEEEKVEVLNFLGIREEYLEEAFSDAYKQFDPVGASAGIKLLGSEVWKKLSNRSRYFISSSLSQLKMLGRSPQLDYSLVSIGFVKALEYELGQLFVEFAMSNDLSKVEYDESDYGEKTLVSISIDKKGKPPTLGGMGYLLRSNQRGKNELRMKLGEFIDSLSCGKYLSSKKFWKEGIYKITHKYRNGGAHDSAIPMKTAMECRDYILGNEVTEGVLKKVMV